MDDKLTVAEIAQHAGIAPSHVRYYQEDLTRLAFRAYREDPDYPPR